MSSKAVCCVDAFGRDYEKEEGAVTKYTVGTPTY